MAVATETHQYLTFTLDRDQYAVNVGDVREVLELTPLTKIPRMPDFMKGVINIRGSVVPVIDLRRKFGMAEAEQTVDTSIIVMDVRTSEAEVTVGCLADSVQEVVDITPDSVEAAPRIGTRIHSSFIEGMGKRGNDFVIILNIDRVFQEEDLAVMDAEATAQR